MRIDRLDRWHGPCLIGLAAIWLWLVYTYSPGARGEGEPGPRAFPVLLGFVLLGLGSLTTLSAFLSEKAKREAEALIVTQREALIASGTFGVLILYAFMLEKLGFLIATPIAVALTMFGILRMRNWILVLSLATGLTVACWMFFAMLLETPLPRGLWLM